MVSTVIGFPGGHLNSVFSTTLVYEDLKPEITVGRGGSGGILSLEDYRRFVDALPAFYFVLAPLGVVTNILNMQGFVKLGINDSVSVTMLCLSLSDFFLSFSQFFNAFGVLFTALEESGVTIFPVDPFVIIYYCGTMGINCYTSTTLITTYLTITRCACVVRPLRFKSMFTIRGTLRVLVLFLLFPHLLYIGSYVGSRPVMGFDPKHNISRVVKWEAGGRRVILDTLHFINNLLIPFACQIIVVVSLITLVAALKSTSAFRRSMNASEGTRNKSPTKKKFWRKSPRTASEKTEDVARSSPEVPKLPGSRKDTKLSGKELRVARQVILISVVFVVTNTPGILRSSGQLIVAEFWMGRAYHNIYQVASHTIMLSALVNASTTLFIYLHFNTAFRDIISGKRPSTEK